MANYNMMDLLNLVEIEGIAPENKIRRNRREAARKAKIRDRETAVIRRSKREKQERDGELYYFVLSGNTWLALHDSELWKPLDKRGRR